MQVVPLQRISSADHLRRVATLAAVFTLSVMAGNTSLKYIPVSFNQAIGATTPAWTALIAYAFAGTTEKRSTYLALAPVILGVVLATGECACAAGWSGEACDYPVCPMGGVMNRALGDQRSRRSTVPSLSVQRVQRSSVQSAAPETVPSSQLSTRK